MPFCNQNGLEVKISRFSVKLEEYRSSCKKCQNFQKNLEFEKTSLELSKNGLRMYLRPLVRFLCSHPYSYAFQKITKIFAAFHETLNTHKK